ncbi:neoverrucotoxin subunit beta-like [Symphorus nematophorus]
MASENMRVAALGRPFTLGMLYDARKDELIPGESLLRLHVFDISTSDSIESKTSLMDIDGSVKASFLGGLIQVGGSAEYLNDTKTFQNQSRVTFQYKATTHFKQLSMTQLVTMDTQHKRPSQLQTGSATHVVTGILYGANAFFVFDSEKLDASNVQHIQGSMEAVIKKIPSFDVEGKIDIKLSKEEKALTKKFSCKFYGDFVLDSNPTTFEAAVRAYIGLPKLLGEKSENSERTEHWNTVPMRVWLMPLKNLHSEAVVLMSEISPGLVGKVQDTLEDLREIKVRCNDSLDDGVAKDFPHIRKDLRRLQKLCDYYESNLKQTLAIKLPSIREGKEIEMSAERLLEVGNRPPFSHEKLSKWLDHKEREINVIRSCVEMMEGTNIVPNQSELDREVLAPGVDHALCFVFTSLESADPCPDVMANLHSVKSLSTNEDPWYYSDDVLIKMREKAGSFQDLAKALTNNSRIRFLVAAIPNEKYTGATIYHYKNGILVTEDFSKPDIPPVKTISDRRDLIWYACNLTLDPNTANNCLTLSEGNKKATYGASQKYPNRPERFDTHPQVLCKEGLTGRHYWEVKWSNGANESVYIAAAYREIERKDNNKESELGNNKASWCFGQGLSSGEHMLKAFHDGQVWDGPLPPAGCDRVGVYLDWPAGTLSFYRVSSNTLSHFYTFNTTFTEPVYPGLWVALQSNYAYLPPFV